MTGPETLSIEESLIFESDPQVGAMRKGHVISWKSNSTSIDASKVRRARDAMGDLHKSLEGLRFERPIN